MTTVNRFKRLPRISQHSDILRIAAAVWKLSQGQSRRETTDPRNELDPKTQGAYKFLISDRHDLFIMTFVDVIAQRNVICHSRSQQTSAVIHLFEYREKSQDHMNFSDFMFHNGQPGKFSQLFNLQPRILIFQVSPPSPGQRNTTTQQNDPNSQHLNSTRAELLLAENSEKRQEYAGRTDRSEYRIKLQKHRELHKECIRDCKCYGRTSNKNTGGWVRTTTKQMGRGENEAQGEVPLSRRGTLELGGIALKCQNRDSC